MAKLLFEPAEDFMLTPTQVRHIRVTAGLSKKGLGKKLGVTYQTVWRWETGRNAITGDAAYKVATFAQSKGIAYE